ncbi:hypothetical protein D3C72_2107360 [compost metagenome]
MFGLCVAWIRATAMNGPGPASSAKATLWPTAAPVERIEAGNTSTSSTTSITAVIATSTAMITSPSRIAAKLPVFISRNTG